MFLKGNFLFTVTLSAKSGKIMLTSYASRITHKKNRISEFLEYWKLLQLKVHS